MSFILFDPDLKLLKNHCPEHVLTEAIQSSRKIIKIIWDEDDTPDHCKGYVQWSVRPFRVTDRCDGTRDSNVMLVCLDFCKDTGLDFVQLYSQAYPVEDNIFLNGSYIAYLEQHRSMTSIPLINTHNICQLLNSLYSMNYRSLVEALVGAWCDQGFDVYEYWQHEK